MHNWFTSTGFFLLQLDYGKLVQGLLVTHLLKNSIADERRDHFENFEGPMIVVFRSLTGQFVGVIALQTN